MQKISPPKPPEPRSVVENVGCLPLWVFIVAFIIGMAELIIFIITESK